MSTEKCDRCGGDELPRGDTSYQHGYPPNRIISEGKTIPDGSEVRRKCMNLDQLVKRHTQLCDEARELMQRKNHDYANEKDVFRNFRAFGRFGILVRLSDKLARLQSFIEKGELKVKDETVKDTVYDILNYSILFESYEELDD